MGNVRRIPLNLVDQLLVEDDRINDNRAAIVSGAEALDHAGRAEDGGGRPGADARRGEAQSDAEFLGGG